MLALVCCLASLPGLFTMPPVDRDESRFAQATRQMVEGVRDAGSPPAVVRALAVPRIQDRPRLNKPPLVYWLQALPASVLDQEDRDIGRAWFGAELATGNIGAFRLISALCALLATLFTWRAGLRLMDPRAAWLGALLLGTCVMVMWDARQARADQLLLACCAGCMWALAAAWGRSSIRRPQRCTRACSPIPLTTSIAFWGALGLGVMTKGPIAPLVVIGGLLAMCWSTGRWRFARELRPLLGLAIVLLMGVPWLGAVAWAQGGIGAYASEVWGEVFVRAAGGKEHFIPVPGVHFVLLAVLFFPSSMLTLAGLIRAFKQSGIARHRSFSGWLRGGWANASAETFLLCWILPAWLVFELTPAKLPHYTMPLYPAIGLLTARAVLAADTGRLWRHTRQTGAGAGELLFVSIAPLAIAFIVGVVLMLIVLLPQTSLATMTDDPPAFDWWHGVALGSAALPFAAVLSVVSIREMRRGHFVRTQLLFVAAWLAAASFVLGIGLPRMPETWVSSQLIEQAEQAGAPIRASSGYAEDSLVFLTRGRLERLSSAELAAWMNMNRDSSVVVRNEPGDWAVPGGYPIGLVWGVNTANMQKVVLRLVRWWDGVTPPPGVPDHR